MSNEPDLTPSVASAVLPEPPPVVDAAAADADVAGFAEPVPEPDGSQGDFVSEVPPGDDAPADTAATAAIVPAPPASAEPPPVADLDTGPRADADGFGEAAPRDDIDVDADDEAAVGVVALALGGAPPAPPGEKPPPIEAEPTDIVGRDAPDVDDESALGVVALALGGAPPAVEADSRGDDGGLAAIGLALEAEPPIPSDLRPEIPVETPIPEEMVDDEGESTVAVPVAAMAAAAAAEDPVLDDELLGMWALAGEDQGRDRHQRWPRRVVGSLAGRWSTMRRGERVNAVLYALTGVSILAMTLELLAGPDSLPTEVRTTPSESASQTVTTVRSTTTVTFTLPEETEPAPPVVTAGIPSRATTPPAPPVDEEEPPPDTTEPPPPTTRPPATIPPTTRPQTTVTLPNTFPTPVPPVPPTFFGPTVPTVTVP